MTTRNLVAIVNPRSGTRRAAEILRTASDVFTAAGFSVTTQYTRAAGHAVELAATFPLAADDVLVSVGGDGTLHEVVNGVMRRSDPAVVTLGVLPGGTGNTVAEHLGVLDPRAAAQRIVAGQIQPFDLMRVTTPDGVEYCANILGWGSAVDINRNAERLRWLGPSRYTVAALMQIVAARRRPARITMDGAAESGDFFFAIGCNTRFTGKGMQLAPRADMGDGLIDLVLVRHASRRQMLDLFQRVFAGTHLALPCVEYRQVRAFAIETDAPQLLNLDGELKCATPVRVEAVPAALRMLA